LILHKQNYEDSHSDQISSSDLCQMHPVEHTDMVKRVHFNTIALT